ncbi:hypothetical protein M8J77_015459 [Diaphorina citri]|nr:hypothetical protein M8J77_015459 [Diaphorina citri]
MLALEFVLSIVSRHLIGSQYNSYVTLKLQNVKSTTVTVKGPSPCWEQDFLFETNDVNQGLLIEVWDKGIIWDRAIGYHYLPLPQVAFSNEVGSRKVHHSSFSLFLAKMCTLNVTFLAKCTRCGY